MKTRKKIVLTRHGVKPKTGNLEVDSKVDAINPESIRRIYDNTGIPLREFVEDNNVTLETSFLRHSDKKRTVQTGKAVLAGAFGFQPTPESQEDLDRFYFVGVDIKQDDRLGYEGTKFNTKKLFANMALYIDNWLAAPNATECDGVPITPYNEVIRAGKDTLVDALGQVIEGEKDLGVIASHASVVDAIALSAINSAIPTPAQSFDQIGGQFEEEGYATLTIDQDTKSGLYKATLQRNGQNYKIDIANLRG